MEINQGSLIQQAETPHHHGRFIWLKDGRKDNTNNKMANDSSTMPMASNRAVTAKDVINFVQNASTGGMMEVDLGNYAAQHAKASG